MKLRKGHFTGFFATIIIFGVLFFYIYMNTQETAWLYSIKETSKERLGRNIYSVVFDETEEYMALVTMGGNLKLSKVSAPKEILYSEKEINKVFFVDSYLVMADKNGSVFSYNIESKEKKNYNADSFNKFINVSENKIVVVGNGKICLFDVFGKEKNEECSIKNDFVSHDDIYLCNDFICIFTKNSADIYEFPLDEVKSIPITEYASHGIMAKNQIGERLIMYINTKGDIIINNSGHEKYMRNLKNPHSLLFSEKLGLIVAADKEKAVCYNELGEKEWEKEMISSSLVLNNEGNYFISMSEKSQGAVAEVISGGEKFTLDTIKKAVFSPKDNYIFALQKSLY